jgi:hypothetical protein
LISGLPLKIPLFIEATSEWMTLLYKVLETCLHELEDGGDPELTLDLYPEFAAQIHPILDDFVQMRKEYIPGPSPEAIRRGRVRLLALARKLICNTHPNIASECSK